MGSVISTIKSLLFIAVSSLIASIVASLVLMLAITSIYQSPLVTLIVSLGFSPFHFSDLKRFIDGRDWLLVAVRFILLAAISSFLVGLFRLALGYNIVDLFVPYLLIVSIPIVFAVVATGMIFASFFPTNEFFVGLRRRWADFVAGGKAYGILWKS